MMHPTPESLFIADTFRGYFRPSFEGHVWQWADENVFFDAKMAAENPRYDSSETPWTREWQDLPLRRDVREASFMKSSQSGVTEGTLNIIRWMPENWPGNVGYIINTEEKARNIAEDRLWESLKAVSASQVTDDPNDATTFKLTLKNMVVRVSGSGSPNPYRETWYRLGVLDEPEDHQQLKDGTTSYDNIQGRFTTVADALLLVLGKPQHLGGIIHRAYLKGTQEKWMVPCPHCGERIELRWDFLRFNHCRDLVGGWDLERVVEDTYYECQECHERIDEHQKRAMVNAGRWMPTPDEDRERLEGLAIKAEPGVRSFHISDLYSLFPGVAWGALAKMYLMAFRINPTETGQHAFMTEHLGRPIEPRTTGFNDTSILNLRGGLVEEDKEGRRSVLGQKFGLVYEDNTLVGELPIARPVLLSITGDRQGDCYKFVVWAWQRDGQAWLIDYGQVEDEDSFLWVLQREYPVPGGNGKPYRIFGGLVDSRYHTKAVWKMCLEAQAMGISLYPSRGEGFNSEYRGRTIRLVERAGYTEDGFPVDVWAYYDHGVKMDFYLGKVARRDEPRLWLPDPVPKSIVSECTAEKLKKSYLPNGRVKYEFVHDKARGPNDLGDCMKKQPVFWQIVAPSIVGDR